MTSQDNQFAQTILKQLGGNKFRVMTGAHNFVYDLKNSSLTMQLRRNKAKAKWMRITLKVNDLYKVEFLKLKKYEVISVKEYDDVYADMLQSIFTSVTGYDTHL